MVRPVWTVCVKATARRLRRCAALLALIAVSGASDARDDADEAGDSRPPHLVGLAVSGKALGLVAGRIDPALPLGDCAAADSDPRVKVRLPNVRNAKGRIRVSLFGREPGQWVRTKGGKLLRFDIPATRGRMEICVPLPDGAGNYAVALPAEYKSRKPVKKKKR